MSLVHLKTFIEVYRQGAFTRAAETLGLTQPAVTQHIAALETVLERQLFQRAPRGATPTSIARDLARRIGDHLDLAEEALAELRARSSRLAGTVHLCGPSDILSDLVAPHLHALCAERIRHDAPWHKTMPLHQLDEQASGRPHVPLALQDFLQHDTMLIDRPPAAARRSAGLSPFCRMLHGDQMTAFATKSASGLRISSRVFAAMLAETRGSTPRSAVSE